MFNFEKIKKSFDFISKLNDLFDRKERIQFLVVIGVALLMAFFQAVGIASIFLTSALFQKAFKNIRISA